MTDSIKLAGLVGPVLIVLNVSEIFTARIWVNVTATQTYLAGALWFVAGLAIIRAHNHWTAGWPVLVTLVGWFALLGGLARMFFPETSQRGGQNSLMVLSVQIVLLVIGIILSYIAYFLKK